MKYKLKMAIWASFIFTILSFILGIALNSGQQTGELQETQSEAIMPTLSFLPILYISLICISIIVFITSVITLSIYSIISYIKELVSDNKDKQDTPIDNQKNKKLFDNSVYYYITITTLLIFGIMVDGS